MGEYTLTTIWWFIFAHYKYQTYTKLIEHGASEWGAYNIASDITKDEYIKRYGDW